jgi:hypothetical protein
VTIRRAFQTVLVMLVAVFAFRSIAEAARQGAVKPRVRHSTAATTGATKARSVLKKKSSAKRRRARSTTARRSASASRKITTKPR